MASKSGDLADVVQQGAGFQGFDLQFGQPEMPRQSRRINLYAIDVIVGDLILRVNRCGERLDRRQVHAADALAGAGALVRLLEVKVACSEDHCNERPGSQQRTDAIMLDGQVDDSCRRRAGGAGHAHP